MDASDYLWKEQPCPICKVRPKHLLGRRGGKSHRQGLGVECSIFLCETCDLVLPDPMPFPKGGPSQHYDVPADDYFKAHDPETKVNAGRELVRVGALLCGKERGFLIDIGPGRGEILKAAQEAGWNAMGVEPSPTFARRAAEFSGAEVRHAAIEEFDAVPGSADIVILSAVLEHLYDPDEMLARISRWLRPGGALFVDVPNERGLYFRIGNLYQRLRGRDWVVNLAPTFEPFHTFGFSPQSLRKLLSKHGLAPQRWRMYSGEAMVPKNGFVGTLESIAATAITTLSSVLGMQTYIETWAVKEPKN